MGWGGFSHNSGTNQDARESFNSLDSFRKNNYNGIVGAGKETKDLSSQEYRHLKNEMSQFKNGCRDGYKK